MSINFLKLMSGDQNSLSNTQMRSMTVNASLATIGAPSSSHYFAQYVSSIGSLVFMSKMTTDNNGNLFFAASLNSNYLSIGRINFDTGELLWMKEFFGTFTGVYTSNGTGVLCDGSHIYVGYVKSDTTGVLKFDYSGNLVTNGAIANPGSTTTFGGTALSDDGLLLYRSDTWNDGSSNQYMVVNTFNTSDLSWVSRHRYIYIDPTYGRSISVINGELFQVGSSDSTHALLRNCTVNGGIMITAASGWNGSIGGITQHSTGLYLAYQTSDYPNYYNEVGKLNQDSTLIWWKQFPLGSFNQFYQGIASNSDDVLFLSYRAYTPTADENGYVAAIDTNGNILWQRWFNIPITSISIDDTSGDLIIIGTNNITRLDSANPPIGTYGALKISEANLVLSSITKTLSPRVFNDSSTSGASATVTITPYVFPTITETIEQI